MIIMLKNLYRPYKYYARYKDGFSAYFYGSNEEDCMYRIIEFENKHGECIHYTGVTDEVYDNGEYVGEKPLYNPN